jgi:erythromycin esterase-like protein
VPRKSAPRLACEHLFGNPGRPSRDLKLKTAVRRPERKALVLAVLIALTPLLGLTQRTVQQQLDATVWPIRTAIPDNDFSDLTPLEKAIGDSRIVALGEATHGTSEFYTLKDRIYRMLVERSGFSVFAMEMPWLSGRAIDTYITTGKGNPRDALAGSFAVYNNQEVLDLIEWMRAYNAAPGPHATLRFVGIDMQANPANVARLIPQQYSARLSCLTSLPDFTTLGNDPKAAAECLATITAVERELPAGSDAQHAATIERQIVQMYSSTDGLKRTASRDRSMASNVRWVADQLYANAKIAIWAHNGHVMTGSGLYYTPMGSYLREAFGQNYYIVGFAFDGGSVSPNGVSAPVSIPPSPPNSIDATLRATSIPMFGLNLRPIQGNTLLGEYVSTPYPMRMLGSFYDMKEALDPQNLVQVSLKSSFDTVVFVANSHAANSFIYEKARAVHPFSVPLGTAGVSWPTQWKVAGTDPASYNAGASSGSALASDNAIWLESSVAAPSAWGSTVARIPVDRYGGKRLRLRGELETVNAQIGAEFWMRVDGPQGITSIDTMSDRPVMDTKAWTAFTITLDVPIDAKDIAFGLILKGRGRVAVRRIIIDAVDASVPTTGKVLGNLRKR